MTDASAWKEVFRLGWIMGFQEYKMTNAGSRLGRYWPTIGMAIRIAFIGTIFGLLLGSSRADYLPWLASGWIVWNFISSSFQNASKAFISSKSLLLSLPLDMRSFVTKEVVKEVLAFSQNISLMIAVLILFAVNPGIELLLLFPALAMTMVFLIGTGLIIAPLLARFRDVGPFINSILSVMLFILPIMWRPEDLGSDIARLAVGFNPFYHYLQILRLPLVGESPTYINWSLGALGSVIAIVLGLVVYKKTKNRIAYWA